MNMSIQKKRFLIPGVMVGLLILLLSINFKSSPSVQPNDDKARLVSVEALTLKNSAPVIVAFGRVEPKNSWQAIAEVSGKVLYRHPELESGRLLAAGTLVLEIDPLEYQLKQAQALANVHSTNAQLTRLQQEHKNLNASLNIEQEKLHLIEHEYKRKLVLKQKTLISSSDVDAQKQLLLAQQKLVQDLSSALNLLPDDQKVAEAQLRVNQALLQDAQRQIGNTRVTLPFNARIDEVNIEQAQAVSSGSVLFNAHSVGAVEVKAELSLQDAKTLMGTVMNHPFQDSFPKVERLGFEANVFTQIGQKKYKWPAKLTRIAGSVDPEQATIGFYLEVNQTSTPLNLKDNPPLTKGMFVSAEIKGVASHQFVIPEKALHGTVVYVMDDNKKLSIREVDILFRNKSGVAITGNIKAGELLIVNDLIPAIPGMSVKVKNSTVARQKTILVNKEA